MANSINMKNVCVARVNGKLDIVELQKLKGAPIITKLSTVASVLGYEEEESMVADYIKTLKQAHILNDAEKNLVSCVERCLYRFSSTGALYLNIYKPDGTLFREMVTASELDKEYKASLKGNKEFCKEVENQNQWVTAARFGGLTDKGWKVECIKKEVIH